MLLRDFIQGNELVLIANCGIMEKEEEFLDAHGDSSIDDLHYVDF